MGRIFIVISGFCGDNIEYIITIGNGLIFGFAIIVGQINNRIKRVNMDFLYFIIKSSFIISRGCHLIFCRMTVFLFWRKYKWKRECRK